MLLTNDPTYRPHILKPCSAKAASEEAAHKPRFQLRTCEDNVRVKSATKQSQGRVTPKHPSLSSPYQSPPKGPDLDRPRNVVRLFARR